MSRSPEKKPNLIRLEAVKKSCDQLRSHGVTEAVFHSLVESIPHNVFSKNTDGCFTFANRQFCRTEGVELSDLIGKTDFDIHPPEAAEKYREADLEVLQTGRVFEAVEEHYSNTGALYFVHVVKAPIYNDHGEIIGLVGIFSDVTEEQITQQELRDAKAKAEQALSQLKQIDTAKTEFLSMVSHELRTPMASILGFAHMIQQKLENVVLPCTKTTTPKQEKAVARIRRDIGIIISESERLSELINDVLDISKMESEKMEWRSEPLNITDVVEQAVSATSSLFEAKKLPLVRQVPDNLPVVLGDNSRLVQVLINLISNAVKFTERGEVVCAVSVNTDHLEIKVFDTGIGIAEKDQPYVFDKFKQLGDVMINRPKGTGLGLPICREIIDHHGGVLRVSSTPGKGSVFSFTLPIHQPAP